MIYLAVIIGIPEHAFDVSHSRVDHPVQHLSSHMPTITYHFLTTHLIPGPRSLSYFIPIFLLPIALLIPRSILSRWQNAALFLPVMTGCTVHAWFAMRSVDVISVDVLLWCVMLLGLRDVQGKFEYVTRSRMEKSGKDLQADDVHDGKASVEVSCYPTRLSERLPWVGTLLTSIRLNNWRIGDPSHDRRQPPAPASDRRTSFVKDALLSFICGYLILDLTRAYISYDPYFTDPTVPIFGPLPFVQLWFIPPRLLRSTIIATQAWAAISQMMFLPCLLPVGLSALGYLPAEWSPHTWAPLFGHTKVILLHGIRGFWSQYWHQAMRVMTTAPSYALADGLRLKRGGLLRYAVITVVAFGLSGLVHMGLVPQKPLYAVGGVWRVRLAIAGFFWLQPIAILLEVFVGSHIVQSLSNWFRQEDDDLRLQIVVNVTAFTAWSMVCLPLLGDMGRQVGYWTIWPVPVSLWKGISGDGWIAWF
jgi:hypothetical protein